MLQRITSDAKNDRLAMLSCKPKCQRQCRTVVLSDGHFGQRSVPAKLYLKPTSQSAGIILVVLHDQMENQDLC